MADTEWPEPHTRIHDFTAGNWAAAYDMLDEELNSISSWLNQILSAAMAQELRITELSADLQAHMDDATVHGAGLSHMSGNWMQIDAADPDHKTNFKARSISLEGGRRLTLVNITGDITVSGANGLDTGAVATNTWYYQFLIYDPALSSSAMLYSISRNSPTMPAGYTEKRFIGRVMTNNAANLRPFKHAFGTNRWELWDVASIVGTVDTQAYVVDISGFTSGIFTTVDFTIARAASPEYSPTGLPIDLLHATFGCYTAASGATGTVRVRPTYNTETSPESMGCQIGHIPGTAHASTIERGLLLPLDSLMRVDVRVDYTATFDGRIFLDGWYEDLETE